MAVAVPPNVIATTVRIQQVFERLAVTLVGASAAWTVPHLLPEARQIPSRDRLPLGRSRTSPALAQERPLPAAESLAQLGPVRLDPVRRIRAQPEGAAVLTVAAG